MSPDRGRERLARAHIPDSNHSFFATRGQSFAIRAESKAIEVAHFSLDWFFCEWCERPSIPQQQTSIQKTRRREYGSIGTERHLGHPVLHGHAIDGEGLVSARRRVEHSLTFRVPQTQGSLLPARGEQSVVAEREARDRLAVLQAGRGGGSGARVQEFCGRSIGRRQRALGAKRKTKNLRGELRRGAGDRTNRPKIPQQNRVIAAARGNQVVPAQR